MRQLGFRRWKLRRNYFCKTFWTHNQLYRILRETRWSVLYMVGNEVHPNILPGAGLVSQLRFSRCKWDKGDNDASSAPDCAPRPSSIFWLFPFQGICSLDPRLRWWKNCQCNTEMSRLNLFKNCSIHTVEYTQVQIFTHYTLVNQHCKNMHLCNCICTHSTMHYLKTGHTNSLETESSKKWIWMLKDWK